METKPVVEKAKPVAKECDTCNWFSTGQALDKDNKPIINAIGAPQMWKDCSKTWGPKISPFVGVIKNTCGIYLLKKQS